MLSLQNVASERFSDLVEVLLLDHKIKDNPRYNSQIMQSGALAWLKRQKANMAERKLHVFMPSQVEFIFSILEGQDQEEVKSDIDMKSDMSFEEPQLVRTESYQRTMEGYTLSLNISLMRCLLENFNYVNTDHWLLKGQAGQAFHLVSQGVSLVGNQVSGKV